MRKIWLLTALLFPIFGADADVAVLKAATASVALTIVITPGVAVTCTTLDADGKSCDIPIASPTGTAVANFVVSTGGTWSGSAALTDSTNQFKLGPISGNNGSIVSSISPLTGNTTVTLKIGQ